MKTAIYARTQDFSPERDKMPAQIEICMAHAENQDVEVYKDYASGEDPYRPEFEHMMKEIRASRIQRVIVMDLSRLSRNFLQLSEIIREMDACGCTILSVADNIDTSIAYDEGERIRELITTWDRRQRMHEMEDSGQYRFYGEKIDEIPDDQVEDRYMQMMNFLSDARTHTDW